MADLKLNEELPLIEPSNIKIKNIKGNVRFVGYGKTNTFSISANSWAETTFNAACATYDTNYLTVSGGNKLKVEKSGLYMFIWHQRAVDNSTSQYAGVAFNTDPGVADPQMGMWGGGVYRHSLHGNWIKHLNVGDTIWGRSHSASKAITAQPISVWVFAIGGSENAPQGWSE